ncbi:MAG TPA: hypothetical protein VIY52_32660 [Streptosporangiaceae bacterium]
MSLPIAQVRHHDVIDGPDGDVQVCASVGSAGEVVAVWTAAASLQAVTSKTVSAGAGRRSQSRAPPGRWPRASPCTPPDWQR